MQLTKKYATNNMHYKNNRIINVKRLVLHSVGCPQPNPDVFVKNWNNSNREVGVHGFIGSEKVVITLPCLEVTETSKPGYVHRAWHCGKGTKGSFNNGYIAFECCEPSNIKYTGKGANFTCSDPTSAVNFMMKVFKNAVEVFAQCCIYHNLDPSGENVIICHKEGNALGYASGHEDVMHLFRQLPFNYSMDQFRADVIARVKELKNANNSNHKPTTNSTPVNKTNSTMNITEFTTLMRKYRASLQTNACNTYSKEARDWAIKNGIISGSNIKLPNGDTNYMWSDLLTREQFITVLYRFAKKYGLS